MPSHGVCRGLVATQRLLARNGLYSCQLTAVRIVEPEQVGAVDKEARKCTKPELLHFQAHGVVPKHKVQEFRVSEDAVLPSGTVLNARHFVPGQYVDVTGISIGKGFQGAMKRWGFKGQPATHGTSRTHRSLGSTGHRKTPGRTWKGKKMHGHMGCDRVTVMGVSVYGIDVRFRVWV